jgi:guanylate kinase
MSDASETVYSMSNEESLKPDDGTTRQAGNPDPTRPGLVVVISGPSGVGKTTISRTMIKRFDAVFSVSATTRPQTNADVRGRDYVFVDEPGFRRMVDQGELLEHALVFDHWYGTPKQAVIDARDAGRIVLLEIDVQGAIQVRKALPDALMVFILPPSEDSLLARLRGRKRDSEAVIQRRFREAQNEIRLAKLSDVYDAFVVNDELDRAIEEAERIIRQALDDKRDKKTNASSPSTPTTPTTT